jgi:hypothetical protein
MLLGLRYAEQLQTAQAELLDFCKSENVRISRVLAMDYYYKQGVEVINVWTLSSKGQISQHRRKIDYNSDDSSMTQYWFDVDASSMEDIEWIYSNTLGKVVMVLLHLGKSVFWAKQIQF